MTAILISATTVDSREDQSHALIGGYAKLARIAPSSRKWAPNEHHLLIRACIFLFFLGLTLTCGAIDCISAGASANVPSGWPWRGVSVNNLTFNPDELGRIKETLPEMNAMRLVIKPRLLAERKRLEPQRAWKDSLTWLRNMLTQCQTLGIIGVVSMNEFPVDPSLRITQSSPEFWGNRTYLDEVIAKTEALIKQIKPFTSLGAVELISEPEVRRQGKVSVPPQWQDLLGRIVKTIRTHSDVWIVATPAPGGIPVSYVGFLPLDDPHILYNMHMYVPYAFTHQGIGKRTEEYHYLGTIQGQYWNKGRIEATLAQVAWFQREHSVPIWVGEFSAARWAPGGEAYLEDLADIFSRNNWGWAYFNVGGMHAWNPDYSDQRANVGTVDWKAQHTGLKSERWATLRTIIRRAGQAP